MIEDAVAAAEGDDWIACLTALLVAWRPQREPALAELIDRVSEHLRVPTIRPDLKAIARSIPTATEAEVGAIADAIIERIPTQSAVMQHALELATARDADPRIATVLACFAPFRSLANPIDLEIVKALDAIDDPRFRYLIVKCAEALVPRRDRSTTDRERIDAVAAIRAKVDARRSPPSPGGVLVAAIRAIDQALARPAPTKTSAVDRASLLAAIYSRPDDTTARLIYADVLQDAGDPRGEFIALQCSGPPTRRERSLLKTHQREWLDGLDPYLFVRNRIFRRGFLAEADFSVRVLQTQPTQLAWHTLESLNVQECSGPVLAGWLPTLRALRCVKRLRDDDVQFVAAHGPVRWTELGLMYPSVATLGLLAREAAKFPTLRTLDLVASSHAGTRVIQKLGPLRLDRLRVGVSIAITREGEHWRPHFAYPQQRASLADDIRTAQRIGIRAFEIVPVGGMSVTIVGAHAQLVLTAKMSREYVKLVLDALPIGMIETVSANVPELADYFTSRQLTALPGASSREA